MDSTQITADKLEMCRVTRENGVVKYSVLTDDILAPLLKEVNDATAAAAATETST
jgi:hypothetical protein